MKTESHKARIAGLRRGHSQRKFAADDDGDESESDEDESIEDDETQDLDVSEDDWVANNDEYDLDESDEESESDNEREYAAAHAERSNTNNPQTSLGMGWKSLLLIGGLALAAALIQQATKIAKSDEHFLNHRIGRSCSLLRRAFVRRWVVVSFGVLSFVFPRTLAISLPPLANSCSDSLETFVQLTV